MYYEIKHRIILYRLHQERDRKSTRLNSTNTILQVEQGFGQLHQLTMEVDCWNIQGRLSRPKFEFPYMVYKYVHAFYRLATGLGATFQ